MTKNIYQNKILKACDLIKWTHVLQVSVWSMVLFIYTHAAHDTVRKWIKTLLDAETPYHGLHSEHVDVAHVFICKQTTKIKAWWLKF